MTVTNGFNQVATMSADLDRSRPGGHRRDRRRSGVVVTVSQP